MIQIEKAPTIFFNRAWFPALLAMVIGSLVLACGTSAPEPASGAASPVGETQTAPAAEASNGAAVQSQSMSEPTPIVVPQANDGRPSKAELAALIPSPVLKDATPEGGMAGQPAPKPAGVETRTPSAPAQEKPGGSTAKSDPKEANGTPSALAVVPAATMPPVPVQEQATATPVPIAPPTPAVEPSPTTAPTETPAPTPTKSLPRGGTKGGLAAELRGIQAWINSDPLTIDGLRGKVVLIDFWTYTCINCIRTLPYLKEWHAKYQDDGLVIIGVHTPEFDFEKDLDNVVKATRDYGVEWAVAQDNDFRTWRAYSNRYWPAKYLIDHEGIVRYTHFGEGQYSETELKIRELLEQAGTDLSPDTFDMPVDQKRDQTYLNSRGATVTQELYAGHRRGYGSPGAYVLQPEYYETRDQATEFDIPAQVFPHKIYFNGHWRIESENARHGRESRNYEDYLELIYSARSVNAVLTSGSGEPYKVQVTSGGEFLTEENKGADLIIGEDGESYLWVTEPKMYRIVETPTYMQNQPLRMASDSEDFGLFAFTFGVYESGA